MKIVIDIPEKTFKYYVTLANKGEQIGNLERIILDGTQLPEHHGRLIDADWVKSTLDLYTFNFNGIYGQFIRQGDIDIAPTIIKGSENE